MRNKIIDSQKLQSFKIRMDGTRAASAVTKLTQDKQKLEEKVVKEKKIRKAARKAFKAKIKTSKKKEEEAKEKIEQLEEEIIEKRAEYMAARDIIEEYEPDYPLPPLDDTDSD